MPGFCETGFASCSGTFAHSFENDMNYNKKMLVKKCNLHYNRRANP